MADEIHAFIKANDNKLKSKDTWFLTDKCEYIRWKTPAREREPLPVTCSRSNTVTLKNQL